MSVKKSLGNVIQSLRPIGRGENIYEALNSERINAIQDAIRLLSRGDHIIAGGNMRKSHQSDGLSVLAANQERVFGGGRSLNFPWKITISLNTETNLYEVRVSPGTINGILPSNMFDNFGIEPTGTFYVTLDCNTDGDSITDASLDAAATLPEGIGSAVGAAPESFQIILGVVVDATAFQIIDFVLSVQPQVTIQTLKDPLVPGEPFYDLNYTWVIE